VIGDAGVWVEGQLARMRAEAESDFIRSGTSWIHSDVFNAGGKLLRPRLVLWSSLHAAETGGPLEEDLARRAALSIELCHLGSLYHDDVVDRSPTRRGLPAAHVRFGVRRAAIGGSHLMCLANSLAAELPGTLHAMLGRAALRASDGQLRETEHAGRFDLEPEQYVRIAERKTGSIFELAAAFGGALGHAPDDELEALVAFGRHLGVAFQLFDDLEDFATMTASHRPAANDLRERVYTLPVLYGCAPDAAEAEQLRALLAEDGLPVAPIVLREVCRVLSASGAFERATCRAQQEWDLADSWLRRLRPTPARAGLENILRGLPVPAGDAAGQTGAS
jgi:heptaprenyl diphosphate synthase